jgi:enamine deaminase RidA (YjgF/YER057c/UK114 family)
MKKAHILCLFLVLLSISSWAQNKTKTSLIDQKLKELSIVLPAVSPPIANYVNAVQTGKLVFLAGKGPRREDGSYITGKVGADLSIEQGYEAAQLTAINQLAALKAEIGNLDRVKRIVKVLGMVNCTPEFSDQPKVINGFSDLMVKVFGDKGKHARSAVGMNALPGGMAVEVEMIVELW